MFSRSCGLALNLMCVVLVFLTGCTTTSVIDAVEQSGPLVAAQPTTVTIEREQSNVEPNAAELAEPTPTEVPWSMPDPTATPEQAPRPEPAPPETTATVASADSGSVTERLAALDENDVDFVDPQKLNQKIQLDSSWQGLGSAELFQGQAAAAGPIPDVGSDLQAWCVEGSSDGSAKAPYWSQREWLSNETRYSAWAWTSSYESVEDAADAIERELLIRERCAGQELPFDLSDDVTPDTYIKTVHTTPAGLVVEVTTDVGRGSGWASTTLHAGPVVSQIVLFGVDEAPLPEALSVLDELAVGVVGGFEQQFAGSGPAPEIVVTSTAGGEGEVGDYPRAESPWVQVSEILDPSVMPRIENDRVDSLLDETYDDLASAFDADHRECLAVQIAVGERNAGRSVSSIILPLYARYCAPELHADWWAEGDAITLDDPDERQCLAHIVFQAEVNSASNGLLDLSWPDLEPVTRLIVLRGLSTQCGLSEADAVRAGLTSTAPLEVSPQLAAYCRSAEVYQSWRIDPPSLLRFYEKAVEIFDGVEAPPGIASSLPSFVAFNEEMVALLVDEPELDQWELSEHPVFISAKASYDMEIVWAEVNEFNRINCVS